MRQSDLSDNEAQSFHKQIMNDPNIVRTNTRGSGRVNTRNDSALGSTTKRFEDYSVGIVGLTNKGRVSDQRSHRTNPNTKADRTRQ